MYEVGMTVDELTDEACSFFKKIGKDPEFAARIEKTLPHFSDEKLAEAAQHGIDPAIIQAIQVTTCAQQDIFTALAITLIEANNKKINEQIQELLSRRDF